MQQGVRSKNGESAPDLMRCVTANLKEGVSLDDVALACCHLIGNRPSRISTDNEKKSLGLGVTAP